jgi:hypothetical protein
MLAGCVLASGPLWAAGRSAAHETLTGPASGRASARATLAAEHRLFLLQHVGRPVLTALRKKFDSTRLRQFARTEAAPAHHLLIGACFTARADYRPVSYNRKEIPDDD